MVDSPGQLKATLLRASDQVHLKLSQLIFYVRLPSNLSLLQENENNQEYENAQLNPEQNIQFEILNFHCVSPFLLFIACDWDADIPIVLGFS